MMELIKIKSLSHFVLLSVLILTSACNSIGTADFKEAAVGTGNVIDSSLIFSGLNSVTDKTDSTVTLHWTAHPDAVAYDIYNNGSYVRAVDGQASDQVTLTGLTPSSVYVLRVRMKIASGKYDGNTTDSVVVMNALPTSPSSIALQAPAYSPSMSASPVVRVSGVKEGDTIKLFSDSACTTEIPTNGDGKVQTGKTSIDLTATSLAPGSYAIYARALGVTLNASSCSTATVAYVRNQCPSGYIAVPHNTDVGTSLDFCVAKYEMKNVSGAATSKASGTPWVSISQVNSKAACETLNILNGETNKYTLISNEEWMTIARNIEQVNENWSPVSGIQLSGLGVLARGHSDNNPANALAASTDIDSYSGTGNSSADTANAGWEQKRTLTLSSGEVIWDFSGNVYEWVDWNVTPAKKAHPFGVAPSTTTMQWETIDTLIGENPDDEMPPEKWASLFVRDLNGNLLSTTLNGSNGLGAYALGPDSSGGAALRGGSWNIGTAAGAFALNLTSAPTYAYPSIGFRCVYRP